MLFVLGAVVKGAPMNIYRVKITTTITTDLLEKARAEHIKISDAVRVGMGVLLAEKGDDTYTGSINIYRKVGVLQRTLTEMGEQLEKIKTNGGRI